MHNYFSVHKIFIAFYPRIMVSCHGESVNKFWLLMSTEVVEDSDNISNSQNTSPLDSTVLSCSRTRDIAKE